MKKTKIGIVLAFSAIFCVTSIAIGNENSKAFADAADEEWSHYSAVAPTYDNPWCNEYWVSCETNIVLLEAPNEGNITNKGAPSDDTIATFVDYSDGRYIPKISEYITYGWYPQTVAPESLNSTLDSLSADVNGWVQYQGKKYEKVTAAPYADGYLYTDGSPITNGVARYFEVEPIKWKTLNLDRTNKTALILSDKILDSKEVSSESSNNYSTSSLRTWLKNDFYSAAFPSSNKLLDTTVDTTYSVIADKVILPNYTMYLDTEYGFENSYSASSTRSAYGTDYAIAKGLCVVASKDGVYWSSSPNEPTGSLMAAIGTDGSISVFYASNENGGVRPAITIDVQ